MSIRRPSAGTVIVSAAVVVAVALAVGWVYTVFIK
jgi:hypothetical protein